MRWKEKLEGRIRPDWAREIDIYETELELKKRGRLDDKLFAETRLRRGAYGQRYDNGQRHDGEATRALEYPAGGLLKGPETLWDAPGMQRIKIPFGKLSAEQLEVLADLAEEYSDGILHVTTRQDIQLHFVHIEDTPDLMRRLAAVGITTREACGNSVRNVTACPLAGICRDEPFDVTPYARALTFFLLGHESGQDMGRKFKVAFSGCEQHACGLTGFHDIGCVARKRNGAAGVERGFAMFVGGGLGPVPHAAELLDDFVVESELLPLAEAVCRVFARLGERANRSRARMKFLLKKLGIVEFRRLVLEQRAALKPDPRWTSFLEHLQADDERPIRPPAEAPEDSPALAQFRRWRRSNVYPQRQAGFFAATVTLPLGDFTPVQARLLAELSRRYSGDALRTTVEQNLLLRWVSGADLEQLHAQLTAAGLGEAGASEIGDVTSCPGTDTCKLGISSSRGLARALRKRLSLVDETLPAEVRGLHVKCSGCFNSCGQHHVADIGFLGVSRNVGGRRVPHFQLVVGGEWQNNGRTFGLAIGAIPSRRVPEALERLTAAFARDREPTESFQQWARRVGRKQVKALVADLAEMDERGTHDPELYRDWGDPRTYTIGDQGTGECAGEVVSPTQFALARSERHIFEAQILWDEGRHSDAAQRARDAMTQAAQALVSEIAPDLGDESDVVATFRARFLDTGIFDQAAVGGRFGHFLIKAHELDVARATGTSSHELIEEAQLFVDAAHHYHAKKAQDGAVSTQAGASA